MPSLHLSSELRDVALLFCQFSSAVKGRMQECSWICMYKWFQQLQLSAEHRHHLGTQKYFYWFSSACFIQDFCDSTSVHSFTPTGLIHSVPNAFWYILQCAVLPICLPRAVICVLPPVIKTMELYWLLILWFLNHGSVSTVVTLALIIWALRSSYSHKSTRIILIQSTTVTPYTR